MEGAKRAVGIIREEVYLEHNRHRSLRYSKVVTDSQDSNKKRWRISAIERH
jgi:hypothetical protein